MSEVSHPSARARIEFPYGSTILVIYNALYISYMVGRFAIKWFLQNIIVSDTFKQYYGVSRPGGTGVCEKNEKVLKTPLSPHLIC